MTNVARLPGPISDLWDWQRLGACRGRDSAQFFHPDGERGASRGRREAAAKSVCRTCPVRAECAAHALATREPYGVWGGFTESERLRLLATGWEDAADHRLGWVDVGRLELRLGIRPTVPAPLAVPAPRRAGTAAGGDASAPVPVASGVLRASPGPARRAGRRSAGAPTEAAARAAARQPANGRREPLVAVPRLLGVRNAVAR